MTPAPLPMGKVRVHDEWPTGEGGKRQVVEILLNGEPLCQLPAIEVRWKLSPTELGVLSVDLIAARAEIEGHV
jgi:hypothetical protein